MQINQGGISIVNKKITARPSTNPGTTADYGMVQTNYDENINMYNDAPLNVISLHEFSKFAVDRLQVLKKIEFM